MRTFFLIVLLVLLCLQSWWVWNNCPQARTQVSQALSKVGIRLEKESHRIRNQ
jgi:hypothetical protein